MPTTRAVRGKIVSKAIMPNLFRVRYQCGCANVVEWQIEGQRQCTHCGTVYQLSITIRKR